MPGVYLPKQKSYTFPPHQETESDGEGNLDDLEKHLREKALRSMRKAQVSPQS